MSNFLKVKPVYTLSTWCELFYNWPPSSVANGKCRALHDNWLRCLHVVSVCVRMGVFGVSTHFRNQVAFSNKQIPVLSLKQKEKNVASTEDWKTWFPLLNISWQMLISSYLVLISSLYKCVLARHKHDTERNSRADGEHIITRRDSFSCI